MNSDSAPTLALAETDVLIRNSVVEALRDDFKVVIAGQPGIGKTAVLLADLMIYDLKLGIRDLRILRAKYPEMPIVLITQKASTTLNEALELDKTDFITKPIDAKELKIRINQCLRKWRFYEPHLSKPLNSEKTGLRSTNPLTVSLPELHSPSGRLNASAIARYLDVSLSNIAAALHVKYTALHKTADASSVQPGLSLFKRILVILTDMLGPQKIVRTWLNSPHPDLGHRSPISVMLDGHADAVLTILENALAGVPS
ncbi:MAG TPA: response regulator [Candidatus Angelobacter sp.]|jgi:DNA-binding NarL/FixJ family response regulator|nr:response regulator [Candidatus Angelobacter sp.]